MSTLPSLFPVPMTLAGFIGREVYLILPTLTTVQRGVVQEVSPYGFLLVISYVETRSAFSVGQVTFVPFSAGAILADFV